MPAARPGCSRPSSAAGPTAKPAARPSRGQSRRSCEILPPIGRSDLIRTTVEGGVAMRTVLDPTGERRTAERERLARPASLEGLTVGLLDISKPRGNVFLDRLEELLTARGLRVERYRKPNFTKPAPVDLRHEISTKCDVVIEALAD